MELVCLHTKECQGLPATIKIGNKQRRNRPWSIEKELSPPTFRLLASRMVRGYVSVLRRQHVVICMAALEN